MEMWLELISSFNCHDATMNNECDVIVALLSGALCEGDASRVNQARVDYRQNEKVLINKISINRQNLNFSSHF